MQKPSSKNLFMLPLALFFFLSIVSLSFGFRDWDQDRGTLSTAIQYAGIAVLVVGCTVLQWRRLGAFSLTATSLLLSLFLAYCLLSAVWSADAERTLAYVASVAATTITLGLWASRREAHMRPAAILAIAAILLGIAILPLALPWRDRGFGFVTPNLIASYGFAIVVLASMFARHSKIPLALAGLTLIFLSQGRTILLVTLVYLAMTQVPRLARHPNAQAVVAGVTTAFALVCILTWPDVSTLLIQISSTILGVEDLSRLDGTLTGRTNLWSLGAQLFQERPLFGHGFATRDSFEIGADTLNAHSGVVNLLLDVGAIGAALYFGAIVFAIRANFRIFHRTASQLAWKRLSFLVAYLVLLIPEPNYLALSHPLSILLMMTLGALFFRAESEPRAPADDDDTDEISAPPATL